MTTLEIYKTRKDEIIAATINLLPTALSGDPVDVSFYFYFEEDDDNIYVDYSLNVANCLNGDNYFYTIPSHERPYIEYYGVDSINEIDFDSEWEDFIEYAIDDTINCLECR